MAIARDSGASTFPVVAGFQDLNSSLFTSAAFSTSAASCLIVVCVGWRNNTNLSAPHTVQWSSGTPPGASGFTKAVSAGITVFSPDVIASSIWYATVSSGVASASIDVITTQSDTSQVASISIDALTGASSTITNTGFVASNNGSSVNNFITLSSVATGSWLYVARSADGTTALTNQTNTTKAREDLNTGLAGCSQVGYNSSGTSGSISVGWTGTQTFAAICAMEVPIGSGPPAPPNPFFGHNFGPSRNLKRNPASRFRTPQPLLVPDPQPPPGSASFWRSKGPVRKVGKDPVGKFRSSLSYVQGLNSPTAKTLYLKDVLTSGGHGALQDGGTPPTNANTTTVMGLGNSSPRSDLQKYANTVTVSGAAGQPSGAPNLLGDSWRTEGTLTGTFAAGLWDIAVRFTVTTAFVDIGNLSFRLWRSVNADGSAAVEISTGLITGSPISNSGLAGTQQICSSIVAVPAVSLTSEYLFLQVAETTSSAGAPGSTWTIRVDSTSRVATSAFTSGASGTNLAAALAGVELLTGNIDTVIQLQAALAGVEVIVGDLTVPKPLAGLIAGVEALTGDLSTAIRLQGNIAGAEALSGALTTDIQLQATLAGVEALSGALTTAIRLQGGIAGVQTLVGDLSVGVGGAALAGTIAGVETLVGALTTAIQLQGTVAGAEVLSGALTTAILMQGTIAGVETIVGALTTAIRLQGTIAGSEALTGALTTAIQLQAALAGIEVLTGDLTVPKPLAAALAGAEVLSGSLTTAILLQGAIAGAESLVGALTTSIQLQTSLAGIEALSGALTTAIKLQGSIAGAMAMTGNIVQFSGLIAGVEALVGDLTTAIRLASAVAGTEALSGALTTAILLQAQVSGVQTLTGALTTGIRLQGSIAGVSALTGVLVPKQIDLTGALAGSSAFAGAIATGIQLSGLRAGVQTLSGNMGIGANLVGLLSGRSIFTGYLGRPPQAHRTPIQALTLRKPLAVQAHRVPVYSASSRRVVTVASPRSPASASSPRKPTTVKGGKNDG